MKSVSITEAKNNLSKLIDGLAAGPVVITDRGRPVARLAAADFKELEQQDAALYGLVRDGLATPPRYRLTEEFLRRPLPGLPEGESLLDAVIAEREEGR